MEMLFKGSPPGKSDGDLVGTEPVIQVDAKTALKEVDNDLAIADTLAVQLDPWVLTFGPLRGFASITCS